MRNPITPPCHILKPLFLERHVASQTHGGQSPNGLFRGARHAGYAAAKRRNEERDGEAG
jgi:hypothetical protein